MWARPQVVAYGRICAEAMREGCVQEVAALGRWRQDEANMLRGLEIEI
jgi:hypothetical protein